MRRLNQRLLEFIVVLSVLQYVGSHAPLFDGTEKTMPKNLKEDTIADKIQENNIETKAVKSMSLFEGDIELTSQDKTKVETSRTGEAEKADVDVNEVTSKRKAIRSRRKIWPSRTIPIQLTPELVYARKNILAVINEIQKNSCLRFRDKVPSDKDYIKTVKKNGCWSLVGRQGGMQELSIGEGCNDKGIILHEMMHALGFWHEQSRTDRDKFVTVLWENVQDGQQQNFNTYNPSELDYVGGTYDYDSAMHYGNLAFSKNNKPTMIAIKDPALQFGRTRSTLSKTDIIQLKALYDCKSKEGGWSSWSSWGPCNLQCTKERERFCTSSDPLKCPGVDSYGIQSQAFYCDKDECNVPVHGHWGLWASWGSCSTTCGQGYRTRSRVCDNPEPRNQGKICEGSLVEVKSCKVGNCRGRRHRVVERKRATKHKPF